MKKEFEFQYTRRDKQQEAFDIIQSEEYTSTGKNMLLVLPTGYGKTTNAMDAASQAVKAGGRVILLSPYKSLTREQTDEFSEYFEVLQITKDTNVEFKYEKLCKYEVFVFTYEKCCSQFFSIDRINLFFKQLNVICVIADEIHNVSDSSRGMNLEWMNIALKMFHPNVHLIGLSATIGNPEEFSKWLDADLVHATAEERPVPLEVQIEEYYNSFDANERMEIIYEYIDKYPNAKFIIFCGSRGRTKEIAYRLASEWDRTSYLKAKNVIASENSLDEQKYLIRAGTCYHNAGLSIPQKTFIEEQFKTNPEFRVLVSTTTLAQGVNLPADVCVMYDVTRWDYLKSEEYLIPGNEIHQMLGRAGRPNISKFGLALVLVKPQYIDRVKEIIEKPCEIFSNLKKDLKRKILETSIALTKNEEELHDFFNNSLEPINKNHVKEDLEWLMDNEFLTLEYDEFFKLKKKGAVTVFTFIKPETMLHLLDVHEQVKHWKFDNTRDYIRLFDMVLNQEEFLHNIVVRQNTNDKNCLYLANLYSTFLDDRIAKAFAMTFLEHIMTEKNIKPGTIKISHGEKFILKDTVKRFINALVMYFKQDLAHKDIYLRLKSMVNSGYINLEYMKIKSIPSIGDMRLSRLIQHKIDTVDKFVDADPKIISRIISSEKRHISVEKVIEMQEWASNHLD